MESQLTAAVVLPLFYSHIPIRVYSNITHIFCCRFENKTETWQTLSSPSSITNKKTTLRLSAMEESNQKAII